MAFFGAVIVGGKGLARLDESDAKGETDGAPLETVSPFIPRCAPASESRMMQEDERQR